MAHLNTVFDPGFLTNFEFPSKTPMYGTIIQKPISGRGEIRASLQPYPLWRIDYNLSFARGGEQEANSVYQYVLGFYMSVGGQFSDFLYLDPNDNSVTDAFLGIGDGATTTFQLTRPIGFGTDIVQNLNGAPAISGNGAVISSSLYTISTTGIVQFTTAPASGEVLTWTGEYYYRVRFGDDSTTFDQQFDQIWNNAKLSFMSVIL